VPPTAVPTDEPEPASGGEGAVTGGPCFNSFFPIRAGTTWRYRINQTESPVEYTMAYEDITGDAFTVLQAFENLTTETVEDVTMESRWQCTETGLLSSEFASISLAQMPDFTFETLDYGGVTLPPADQMAVGATWESTYTINTAYTVEGMDVSVQMEVMLQNEVAAVEQVTVQAGTYPEAYRVDSSGTMQISANAGVSAMDIPFSYSIWYVEGVGMVKQTSSDGMGGTTVTELISME
jgi:hypothetical protein